MSSVSAPPRPSAAAIQSARSNAGRGLRRARRHPGEFGTVQLVAIEIAAVAIGLSLLSRAPVVVAVAVAAALGLLAAVFSRAGGWWGYQAIGMRSALRRRQRALRRAAPRQLGGGPMTGQGAVALLAPGFRAYDYDDRGSQIGIGQDERGWFAAVALGVAEDVLGQNGQAVRLDRLVRLLDEGTARPSAVQFVSLRVPAPSGLLGVRTPCVESYLELAAQVTGERAAPAEHLTWIAVRLSPTDAIEAAADRGGGIDGVNRALAAVVGRIGKFLGTAAVTYRVLDAAALTEALEASCGFDRAARPSITSGAVEHWRGWLASGLRHAAFEVDRWPAALDPSLLHRLTSAPAERLAVSVVVRPRGAALGMRTVVRVMATNDQLGAAVRTVNEHAAGLGLRLRPMHGLHCPAVYASAPTGGGTL